MLDLVVINFFNTSSPIENPQMCYAIYSLLGLWMADLSVNQIFQEEVEESWRGRINGVQHALNMTMDLLKYGLVILLPSAETFGLLVLASFIFICSGLSYSSYCMYQT